MANVESNDPKRAKRDEDNGRKDEPEKTSADHGSPADAEQDEQKPGDAAKKERRDAPSPS